MLEVNRKIKMATDSSGKTRSIQPRLSLGHNQENCKDLSKTVELQDVGQTDTDCKQ